MKHFEFIHNTGEWFDARAGIATTSSFNKILTAGGDLSKQADAYANKLIAELMLGEPIDRELNVYALQWGQEHEADAAALYEFETGLNVIHGGFFTNDDMTRGASPDVRVFDGDQEVGLGEIKCPENPAVHVEFLLKKEINKKYYPQVQGQLLVCEAEWVDWFSYYPKLPSNRIRTYRDEKYIAKLDKALIGFEEIMMEKLEQLKQLGHINEIPKKLIKPPRQKAHTKQQEAMPAI